MGRERIEPATLGLGVRVHELPGAAEPETCCIRANWKCTSCSMVLGVETAFYAHSFRVGIG
jgi:hypothetical protein